MSTTTAPNQIINPTKDPSLNFYTVGSNAVTANLQGNLTFLNTDKEIFLGVTQNISEQKYFITQPASKSAGNIEGSIQFKSGEYNAGTDDLYWNKDLQVLKVTGQIHANSLTVDSLSIASFSPQIITLGSPSSFKLGGGNAGQVLTSDGAGGTYWNSSTLQAAGSNTQIQFNSGGGLSANSLFTYNTANGVLTVPNVNVTGGAVTNFKPAVTNSLSLGTSSFRWRNQYLQGNLILNDNPFTITGIGSNTSDTTISVNGVKVIDLIRANANTNYDYPLFNSTISLRDSSNTSNYQSISVANANTYLNNAYLQGNTYIEGNLRLSQLQFLNNTITTNTSIANINIVSNNGTGTGNIILSGNIIIADPTNRTQQLDFSKTKATFGAANTISIGGGNLGQYLQTDGAGNLSWANLALGGINTHIQFNNNGNLGGSSAFTFDVTSNTVTLTGHLVANTGIANEFTTNNIYFGNSTRTLTKMYATQVTSAVLDPSFQCLLVPRTNLSGVDLHITAIEGSNAKQVSKITAINFNAGDLTNYQEYSRTHVGTELGYFRIEHDVVNLKLMVETTTDRLINYNIIVTEYYDN